MLIRSRKLIIFCRFCLLVFPRRARARVSRAPNPKSGKMGNAPSRGFALNAVTARREKTTHRKTKIANHDRSIGFQGTGFAGLNALRGPRFARIISGARWWRFGDQQSQTIYGPSSKTAYFRHSLSKSKAWGNRRTWGNLRNQRNRNKGTEEIKEVKATKEVKAIREVGEIAEI